MKVLIVASDKPYSMRYRKQPTGVVEICRLVRSGTTHEKCFSQLRNPKGENLILQNLKDIRLYV